MEVKTAVHTALQYVKEVFEEEKLSNLGLEEVEFVPERGEWLVTVGFSRPWDFPREKVSDWQLPVAVPTYKRPPDRDYKVVHVDDLQGQVLAIKNRDALMPSEA